MKPNYGWKRKSLVIALLLCGSAWSAGPSSRWEINLERDLKLQSFDRPATARWTEQQGVVFLTPEKILIYQVNRTQELAKLGPRSAGGGAGNFLLNLKVLSAQDGHVLKTMDVVTSGDYSKVLATRDGGFLVRAGNALYLYSAQFEKLASRELPLERIAQREDWQIKISPSGEKAVLVHEQIFMTPELLADKTVIHDGKAKVDVHILNAATLAPEKDLSFEHALSFWAPAEGMLISSNPAHSYADGQVGTMDFEGKWSPMRSDVPSESNACHLGMIAVDRDRAVLFGCDSFTVLSTDGKRLFAHNDARLVYVSAVAMGQYLAVQCDRYRLDKSSVDGGSSVSTRADRIEVYDLESGKRRMSVPIRSDDVYYAVSASGDVAVIDGPILRVYQVAK